MRPHGRELVRGEWVIALALLVLVPCLVGLWAVDRQRAADLRRVAAEEAWSAYDAAYASCQRGNTLRAAANEQARALRSVSFILTAFFDSSVDLRLDANRPGLAEQARRARDAVADIADRIQDIESVNCATAIVAPSAPRPSD